MRATVWIRFHGRDVWHFAPACQHLRGSLAARPHDRRATKPKSGEFCDECRAKARRATG